MKTKSFLTVILILYCVAGLSLYSNAEDKQIQIKDVEYLTGSDFVQLHFKINKMIPIPDVFYPDKNNNTRIIMRIHNASIQLGKETLSFDSAVIDKVRIDNSKSFSDVEILLKKQLNYRVFTNRKGLYIEFPEVKNLLASAKSGPGTKKQNSPPVNRAKKRKAAVKAQARNTPPVTTPADKALSRAAKTPAIPNNPDQALAKGRTYIKDIVLRKKADDSIAFDIMLSDSADFYVIPIPDDPVRLAIDFKNTDARRIKKIIDQLNVKKIRGAYNSASVYRLVFDLHYLKNYKVSPKNAKGNVLEVAFFNNAAAQRRHTAKANKITKKTANTDKKNRRKKQRLNKQNAKKELNANASRGQNKNPKNLQAKANHKKLNNKKAVDNKAKARRKKKNNKKAANKRIPTRNKELLAKNNVNTASAPQVKTSASKGTVIEYGKKTDSNIVVSHNSSGVELRDIRTAKERRKASTSIQKVPEKIENSKPAPIRTNPGVSETQISDDFFSDEQSEITQEETAKMKPAGENRITYNNQTISGGKQYTGKAMGFNFHNADLKDVVKIIAKISGLNIVMDPGISGRITSQLSDVPWDQALELFLKINGLDMIREGNILRIGNVDKLAKEAESRRSLKDARQNEDDLEVFTKTLSFAKVAEISAILTKQLSKRGEMLQDPRTNTLIISEIPSKIVELKKLLEILDTANPQVSIEARIVETKTNYIESFGIQWGYNFIADSSHGNQTTLKFPSSVNVAGNQFQSDSSPLLGPLGGYAVNLPATGATSGTVFSLGNVANTLRLDMALSAMQSDGHGRVISAPKTTTQNNMEATIMQGKQIPVQTIQNNTITVVYRPAALELKVTPQITADGTVVTKLEIKNNSADFGNLVNGIPPIETQTISTTVMVPDGGTIVIGGMYKVEKTTTKFGVPILSKIPLLGNLFRSASKRNEQRELLVFITPRIIK